MAELAKIYESAQVEEKWGKFWLENKLFESLIDESKKPFSIVIPPPNVTGSLHMGHALNSTLQDIIIRFKRMQGYNVLWVPGTDHGGIATQNVVEKLLLSKGKSRHELGREKFIESMWQWRKETGDTILGQLEKIGCSIDWSRTRFTMDEVCSRAVVKAFVELFNKGLIYRGKRLVNWCPRCNTALSDIEVEHEEEIGKLWHIQYPVKGENTFVVVATTRPETMLGDTAVAVNPEDERYKNMIGKMLILPLIEREIPIVADAAVDPAFGTGAVKVTPAHDPTDFDIGMRHNLPQITVIDFKGSMTQAAGPYAGLDRYVARKKILADLEAKTLLLETAKHPHSIGHCYRCDTVIEPLISEQWFLKVEEMSKKAIKVVEEGKVKIHPQSWEKPYTLWLENLKDWCISRQIWWGHRIPVYYCVNEKTNERNRNCKPVAGFEKPEKCPYCGNAKIEQDEDVLDTWFSSALWPFSVFGWPILRSDELRNGDASFSKASEGAPASSGVQLIDPKKAEKDLKYYYPTAVLATGHEILYLWVARMIQFGLEFMGDVPFRDVFIHGIVRDKSGKKMSKSLGNVIDPLGVISKYGADALRFSLTQSAAPGRDMQLSDDSFLSARNFANKMWNASRFVFMNLESANWQKGTKLSSQLELCDKWILSEFEITAKSVSESLESYNMDAAARVLYEFFWSKFCDWYIELAKIRLTCSDENRKTTALSVLIEVLYGVLKLMHPIMPFITEEIWQKLCEITGKKETVEAKSLMQAQWPKAGTFNIDNEAVESMRLIQEIVTAVRAVRSEMNVSPAKLVDVKVKSGGNAKREIIIKNNVEYLKLLAKASSLEVGSNLVRPEQAAVCAVAEFEVFIPLAGLIDLEKEKQRLSKDIENAENEVVRCNKNLSNEGFISRAPQKEVERIKSRLNEAQIRLENLKRSLKALG